jgi:hypothetical protein
MVASRTAVTEADHAQMLKLFAAQKTSDLFFQVINLINYSPYLCTNATSPTTEEPHS